MRRFQTSTVFSPQERNLLLFTGVAHAATHYAELLYPTLAVALSRETGIPLEQVLKWSFPAYLLFGIGALPGGYLADRLGARRLILGGFATMALATVAAGLSSPGPSLAISLAVMGLAASVYHPAGMGLISRGVRARGRALGINGMFGNAGIAMTPVATAALAERFGWRGALLVSGGLLCLLTLWFMRLPIQEPGPGSAPAVPHTHRPATASPWLVFVLICVTAMLGGISYRGNTLAQPAYFAERVSVIGYGAATSLALLLGVAGQYMGGIVADRRDLRWSYFFFHLASLPALLLMMRMTELTLVATAATFTFFSLGMQPIENSLFAAYTPDRWRSTGYGAKFVLTFGVGSMAVWLVTGIGSTLGMSRVFGALAVVVALILAVILILATLDRPAGREIARETGAGRAP